MTMAVQDVSSEVAMRRGGESLADSPLFTRRELTRVGTATAMVVVLGALVIIASTIALGHYNSLVHAAPKAVVDGAAIALLVGLRGRFRCLALMGIVYGLVLLAQIGVVYLVAVMALAGVCGALTGRGVAIVHRAAAVYAAAVVFELAASLGYPVKILLASEGRSEPFLWGLWLAEWPLRIAGACVGVWLGLRGAHRQLEAPAPAALSLRSTTPRVRRVASRTHAGIVLALSLIGFILPALLNTWSELAGIAIAFLGFGLLLGLSVSQLTGVTVGLFWGWLVFATLSFAWHRETAVMVELLRSFALRFAPMAIASALLVQTVRPLDLLRLLRSLRLPRIVLLPLAGVLREVPVIRHALASGMASLREQGVRVSPLSLIRRPGLFVSTLVMPVVRRYATTLGRG